MTGRACVRGMGKACECDACLRARLACAHTTLSMSYEELTGLPPGSKPAPPLPWSHTHRGELPPQRPAQAARPAACVCAGAVARLVSRSEQVADDMRDLWLAAGVAMVLGAVALVLAVLALAAAW